MSSVLPPAPLWEWSDKVTCCICAPHAAILLADDWRFLWRLARRADRGRGPFSGYAERLDRIVKELDCYAQDQGIVWP